MGSVGLTKSPSNDEVVSAGEQTLISDENEAHAHLFTKESWRSFFNVSNGTSAPSLTLLDAIKSVKSSLETFYDTQESTQRVISLQLPDGVAGYHENVAPKDFFSDAGNSASLDHTHAYLNVRGGSANSVSLPIQESVDLSEPSLFG